MTIWSSWQALRHWRRKYSVAAYAGLTSALAEQLTDIFGESPLCISDLRRLSLIPLRLSGTAFN